MNQIKFINIKKPFLDQRPGTSGLRKSTLKFKEKNYLEIFIEAILRSLNQVEGSTIIIGGDGRYGNYEAIQTIIKICAAHKVGSVMVAADGLLSTPAASNLIRLNDALAGIILSASHNPGGLKGDFGVKLNVSNGGPAPESLTNKIFECSKNLTEYKYLESSIPNLSVCGTYHVGDMKLEIVDGIKDYFHMMEKIFDFDQISDFLKCDFPIIFDAMSAITGPYAKKIFLERIGLSEKCLMNANPLPDFGNLHPDPNLTYAQKLADLLLIEKSFSFGAACDGDGDRNMILGKGCFINPSDSLAVITANTSCVPGFKDGISGVARSMPTSMAVDYVAEHLNIPCFETPTGWKFFGNLLDSGKISICGEESFGTGSNHVREKDGLWAVLFWLQILAEKKCSVDHLINNHWAKFGRNYYSRHDYEAIPTSTANQIYGNLINLLPRLKGERFAGQNIKVADNFSYVDPIDGSISSDQGIRIILENGSRAIVRLSGTGTKGATLRLYFEKFNRPNEDIRLDPQNALKDLIVSLDQLLSIKKLTKMSFPTVIT